MKFAHVATKWIGTGDAPDDKYRVDMPVGYSRMFVRLHQYVKPDRNYPSPNIGVVLILESRETHEGYIERLTPALNQVVIELWVDDGRKEQVASERKLANFLIRQGMDDELAAAIATADDRVQALLAALQDADLRSRRRIELGL